MKSKKITHGNVTAILFIESDYKVYVTWFIGNTLITEWFKSECEENCLLLVRKYCDKKGLTLWSY